MKNKKYKNDLTNIIFICYDDRIIRLNAVKYFFLIFVLFILLYKSNFFLEKRPFYFDQYQTEIFNIIKEKLKESKCSLMFNNQKEFLNGVIRKYMPKKILEIGVLMGGSSIIILNSIKDFKNSHLYSIDINGANWIGNCVKKYFPYLSNKWTLFKGNIAANYIEKIGKNIDLAIIDTSHFEPGEILDFLMILPFLKEKAIIIFHDIDHQITEGFGKEMRNEWAPYIIFNIIRGKKFLPSGKGILNKDIGAIKLEKKQKRFIHDYCRALGGQWQYIPKEEHIKIIINFFEKYYDKECVTILKESLTFNKKFIKNNPKKDYYDKARRKGANKVIINLKNKTFHNITKR